MNHDLYRFSTEAKREFWRVQKAEQRAKNDGSAPKLNRQAQATFREKKTKKAKGRLPGEITYEKAVKAGAHEEELDRLSEPFEALTDGSTLRRIINDKVERIERLENEG